MDENDVANDSGYAASATGGGRRIQDSFNLLGIGFVAGVGLGLLVHKLFFGFRERAPIIVRGGSLSFETDSGWEPDCDDYAQKPNDDDPAPAKWLEAIVEEGNGSGKCKSLKARTIFITYDLGKGSTEKFHIKLVRHEPRVGPKGKLKQFGNQLVHDDTTGYISEIQAGSDKCSFPLGEVTRIKVKIHD